MQISIVIPSFNKGLFLTEAIDSAVKFCEGSDSEILVIDDCSTDKSIALAKKKFLDYALVRFLSTDENSGPSAVRKLGLDTAKYDWVCFLDADDVLVGKLCDSFPNFKNYISDKVVGIHGFSLKNGRLAIKDKVVKFIFYRTKVFKYESLMAWVFFEMPNMSNLIMRKELVQSIDVSHMNWGEDIIFLLQAIQKGSFLKVFKEFSNYRIDYSERGSKLILKDRLVLLKEFYSKIDKASISQLLFCLFFSLRTLIAFFYKKVLRIFA